MCSNLLGSYLNTQTNNSSTHFLTYTLQNSSFCSKQTQHLASQNSIQSNWSCEKEQIKKLPHKMVFSHPQSTLLLPNITRCFTLHLITHFHTLLKLFTSNQIRLSRKTCTSLAAIQTHHQFYTSLQ